MESPNTPAPAPRRRSRWRRPARRWAVLSAGTAAALIAGTGVALATVPDGSGVFHGHGENRHLRTVDYVRDR